MTQTELRSLKKEKTPSSSVVMGSEFTSITQVPPAMSVRQRMLI